MEEEKAEWYWLQGKVQSGPHPLSKVTDSVAQGIVTRTTSVWRQGWPEWRAADSVPELFAPTTSPADTSAAAPAGGAAAQPSGRSNYVARHWRGDFSLAWSFWVNGVLIGIAYQIAMVLLAVGGLFFLYGSLSIRSLLVIVLVAIVMGPILTVWQNVGAWRSASLHEARGGRRVWAVVVKILIVIWTLVFIASLIAAIMDVLK